MGVTTLAIILPISLLFFPFMLLRAQEHFPTSCPSNFQCGTDNLAVFPLYDDDTSSRCGLIEVSCNGATPKINLGWSQSRNTVVELEVTHFLSNQSANVSSQKLQDLIKSKTCDIFSYFSPLYYSPDNISYTISPNLTLFNCDTGSPDLRNQSQDFFYGNYFNYSNCPGSTIYYPHTNRTYPNSKEFPDTCKVIQLPIIEGKLVSNDFFSLLTSNFTLGWEVSSNCMACHDDGGICSGDKREFKCIKDTEDKGISQFKVLATVSGAAFLLLFLIFLLTLTIRLSKSYGFKSKNNREVENFLKNHGSLSPKRYTHFQLKKMTNSFKIKLGQGGFGSVFKGKLNNGHDVAVKLLKEAKGSGEEFINEVAAISRTSHVNIVSLIGYCFESHKRALVYEYLPNGSLEKFICYKNSEQNKLGWDVLYNIVIGIARGLEYLHRGCNTQILHLDIKPHNILLDEDFCPKISDFGLAKLCPRKESIVSLLDARGTIGYIAPEVFCRNFGRVSNKSDVYSYGMMVLEMVGGRENRNIEVEVGHTSDIYFPNWIYKHMERNEDFGFHNDTIEDANENLRKMIIVGLWCIQTDPTNRPSMTKVVDMLEGTLEDMEIPPKPYLSSPSRFIAHSSTHSYHIEKLFNST